MRPYHYRKVSSIPTPVDCTLGRQPQRNLPLRIANADEDEIPTPTLAFPKAVAQKGKPPRSKPTWLSPITTKAPVGLPPPVYTTWSAGQETLIPMPTQRPAQKYKATPMPPTPPISSTVPSKTSTLVVPDYQPVPIISPARSESFAPKDLIIPSPPTLPSSSRVERGTDVKLPRLMNVVALYTPNLPDELHIKVGDTLRIIEDYKDGWCFVQFLGRKDAPKGVVPLMCLQERKRLVPFKHNASNSSLTSLKWR
ncbi:hypothetical protein BYT27DRAFT_7094930 [Phlegmacium glaucopus]|nr:hypothetical protein BYT27DRAFT_7094930 [Phlegmacium glaucopus]